MFKSIVLGVTLALSCAMPLAAQQADTLHDQVPEQYRNGIKVAVFNDWPPDEFVAEDGTLKGWSIDIAHEMEKRLGVKFEYSPISFDAIIPGLMAKRFDAGFSSFGTTAERLKSLDFVAQRKIGSAFAYPKTSKLDIKTEADACGLKVGVLNGSWDVPVLEKMNKAVCADKPMTIETFQNQAGADLAVRSNRIDTTITSSVKLAYQAQQTHDIKVSQLVLNAVNSCIGLRKGDPLGPVMVKAIQSMMDDGTYQKIMEKWGVADSGMLKKSILITEANPDL